MGAYKRDVFVVIKMGAYIHGVLVLRGTVGTGKVRLRQVRTYHADLAVTSRCMAVDSI